MNSWRLNHNVNDMINKPVFATFIVLILFCWNFRLSAQPWTLYEKWVDCGNGIQLLDPYYSDGVSFEWTGGSKNGKAHGK